MTHPLLDRLRSATDYVSDDFERCPAHPDVQVRRVKDTRQPVMNGYPVGKPIVTATHYECSECGKPLALANKEGTETP